MPEGAISVELVREFVGAAHFDLDRVKELLEQEPGLLHAAMNWRAGDWETALGAASHVGRRDIAEYLLARGARLDIFAAAMLGYLEIVKGIIERNPQSANALGPHGIPLIQHAVMGGEQAKHVVEYLNQWIKKDKESDRMVVVVNTIHVKPGYGELLAERFKTPKRVHTFPGFVRMELQRTEGTEEYEEYKVCTTWESKEAFDAWVQSDSFKHAHSQRQEDKAGNEMVIGNKITIHEILVTHLPAVEQNHE